MKENDELKKQAMGIVNQLFDLAEVPVEKRQAINDKSDEYVIEQLRLCVVSQQRELLIALKECRRWMINKGVNVDSEFFKSIDKAINCG